MNTVYSELHERLNQMVNYSSQLIFVSSDTIAAQRKTLESFLATQDEQTDVAFITANPELDITQYRRQLCQQLLGQVAGSFIRPLNELLQSLNHHDGPVLIGIMQAQELPNEFLRELWQLVLQSRFAANKQHLNIVLFGETDWAERAQQWLPATNTATPLLLSSEVVSGATSDLDRLIAEKRAAFQRRLADRANVPTQAESRPAFTRSPIFALLAIAVFIVIFGGLLWWQYPDKVAALFGFEGELVESSSATEAPTPVSASSEMEPVSANPQSADGINSDSVNEPADSVTEQLLVSRWQRDNETASMDSEQPSKVAQETLNTALIPAVATKSQPVTLEQGPADEISDPSALNNAQQAQEPPSKTDENQSVYAESQSIKSQPDQESFAWLPEGLADGFVIQLTGVSTLGLAEQFIVDNNLSALTWVYQAQLNGNPWYVIVTNKPYPTIAQARDGISQLPNYNQVSAPFVKSIAQIKRQQINVD
ncbi:SPOR domain-containing protein [Alteromonas flava]|uniref:SPOR domain-containing protein n=1 Tax=Alteromonas flava TaxID=2048003 RepID=UPI000F5E0808|nr:hypothetical protein [Alteromonas flava]